MRKVMRIIQLILLMFLSYKTLTYVTVGNYKYTIIYTIINILTMMLCEKLKEAII